MTNTSDAQTGPLKGVTVLDIGLLVQGPQAAAAMQDMGADVIKVELPGMGDHARWIFCATDDQRSAYFTAVNRGKRGMTIDLRKPEGVEVFLRLVERADVLISNFKPGTLEEWGLGFDVLSARNPRLIWGSGSAFGTAGPDALREGADLAGQSAGGLISTVGEDGQPPSPVGVTIADHIASQNLTAGVLAALFAREQTGRGQKVEVSLLGGQVWAQAAEYTHYLMTDEVPGRANYGHPLLRGIYRIVPTADGWLGIIGVPPHVKDDFFLALGRPDLGIDPRFDGLTVSRDDLNYLFGELNPVFQTKTTAQWCEQFRELGIRYAPVRDYAGAAADPQVWDNGYLQEIVTPQGAQKVVACPISMSDTPLQPAGLPPELGEHTQQILADLGYSDEEIVALQESGSV